MNSYQYLSTQLEDETGANKICERVLKYFPDDYERILRIITFGYPKRYRRSLSPNPNSLLRRLRDDVGPDGQDRLTSLFLKFAETYSFHHYLAYTIQRTIYFTLQDSDGSISSHVEIFELANEGYKSAERAAQKDTNKLAHLRLYHGLLLYYQGDKGLNDHAAIDIWEKNIHMTDYDEYYLEGAMVESSEMLAAAFFGVCKRSNWDPLIVNINTMKFSDLQQQRSQVVGRGESFLVARIHCEASAGPIPKAAKELVRPHIQEAMNLLPDEDPSNDWQGYYMLAEALSFVDQDNALVAWSLISPHEISEPSSESSKASVNEDVAAMPSKRQLSGPLAYAYDGECGHEWTFPDDIYFCLECVDVQFDAKCLDFLNKGYLTRRVCGKDYKFLHIPPWDEEAFRDRGEGNVLVGGKIVKVKDWLQDIREVYLGD